MCRSSSASCERLLKSGNNAMRNESLDRAPADTREVVMQCGIGNVRGRPLRPCFSLYFPGNHGGKQAAGHNLPAARLPAQVGQARLAWTVPVRGGPGSALHRFAEARAASRPGHAIAPDAFGALFTFQTAQIFSFPRRSFASGVCNFASLTPNRGVGGAPIRRTHIPTSPQVAPERF